MTGQPRPTDVFPGDVWEYCELDSRDGAWIRPANKLGEEGWELVAATAQGQVSVLFCFKRRKRRA